MLRQVIPTADRTKATVLTKVTLLEKDKDLKPEMSAKVTFLEAGTAGEPAADAAPAKPVILVPQAAVVTRDGGQKVFEVVDGTAQMRPVTTSGTRRDLLVVTDGLGGLRDAGRPPTRVARGRRPAVNVKGGQ